MALLILICIGCQYKLLLSYTNETIQIGFDIHEQYTRKLRHGNSWSIQNLSKFLLFVYVLSKADKLHCQGIPFRIKIMGEILKSEIYSNDREL